MLRSFLAMLLFASVAGSVAVSAAQDDKAVEHDFIIKDFRFASGETLPELRIHYATLGTQRGNNVVLVLHGTGGSFKQFINDRFGGVLFRKGGLLDAEKYFIVIPDNVGHGASSKPSDGRHRKFPQYAYNDMIELQHRLIADELHADHLRLIIGTSMGAMHAWMWGERWPKMMDALVPLASNPVEIAGRNRVWRKAMIDELRNDPQHGLETALHMLLIAGSAPILWQHDAPTREAADRWLDDQMKQRLATNNADDLLYALESSRD